MIPRKLAKFLHSPLGRRLMHYLHGGHPRHHHPYPGHYGYHGHYRRYHGHYRYHGHSRYHGHYRRRGRKYRRYFDF